MTDDFDVELILDGLDPDTDQQRVLDLYERNVETFIRKNRDYGSSFVKSGMIASIYECGEIDPDIVIEHIARQLSVRMQDKQARLYQTLLADDHERQVADESTVDSLLDLGNYAIMLASQLIKYQEGGFVGQHPELETLNDLTSADTTTLQDTIDEFGITDSTAGSSSGPNDFERYVVIDEVVYPVEQTTMTGRQLLELADKDPDQYGIIPTIEAIMSPISPQIPIDLTEMDTFDVVEVSWQQPATFDETEISTER